MFFIEVSRVLTSFAKKRKNEEESEHPEIFFVTQETRSAFLGWTRAGVLRLVSMFFLISVLLRFLFFFCGGEGEDQGMR